MPDHPKADTVRHRVEVLAKLLDSQFRLPGTNFRFGWDGLIGLLPGADLFTTLPALYILFNAKPFGNKSGAGASRIIIMPLSQNKESIASQNTSPNTCSTGGCGGPGLCPGVALLLAYVVGGSIALLTGIQWLGWVVGVPLAIILITGAWRFLRSKG